MTEEGMKVYNFMKYKMLRAIFANQSEVDFGANKFKVVEHQTFNKKTARLAMAMFEQFVKFENKHNRYIERRKFFAQNKNKELSQKELQELESIIGYPFEYAEENLKEFTSLLNNIINNLKVVKRDNALILIAEPLSRAQKTALKAYGKNRENIINEVNSLEF